MILRVRDQYSQQLSLFRRSINALFAPVRALNTTMGRLLIGGIFAGAGILALRRFGVTFGQVVGVFNSARSRLSGFGTLAVNAIRGLMGSIGSARSGVAGLVRSLGTLLLTTKILSALRIGSLAGLLLGGLSVGGAAAISKSILDIGIQFNSLREQSAIAFSVAGDSAEQASAQFAALGKIADYSKFSIQDIQPAAASLRVVGYTAAETNRILQEMANALGALPGSTADSLGFMTSFFRRAKEFGVVGLGEIETLDAAGIPALQLLGKQFGLTGDMAGYAMRQMLMKGLPSTVVLPKLQKAMDEYYKEVGKKQNETWEGALRTIGDKVHRWIGGIMKPAFEGLRLVLINVIRVMEAMENVFHSLPAPVQTVIKWAAMLLIILLPIIWAVALFIVHFRMLFAILRLIAGFLGIRTMLSFMTRAFGVLGNLLPLARLSRLTGLFGLLGRVFSAFRTISTPLLAIFGLLDGWFLVILVVLALLYLAWTNNWFGIRDTLTSVWNDYILPVLSTLWGWLLVLAGWAGVAWNFTVNLLGQAWQWIVWLVQQIGVGLGLAWNFTANLLNDAWNWIIWLAGIIGQGLTWAWNFSATLLNDTWTWIVWLGGIIGKGLTWSWNFAATLVNDAWTWIKWIYGQIAAAATWTWQAGVNLAGQFWNWIQWIYTQIINPAASWTWQAGVALAGDFWTWIQWIYAQIQAAGTWTWQAGVALAGGYWNWIQWIYAQIQSVGAWTWQAGAALVGGYWNWIQWIYAQIQSVGAWTWQAGVALAGDFWSYVTWIWGQTVYASSWTWQAGVALAGDFWTWIQWIWNQTIAAASWTWQASVNLAGAYWNTIQWIESLVSGGAAFAFSITMNVLGAAWDTIVWLWEIATGRRSAPTVTAPAMPSPISGGGGGGGGGSTTPGSGHFTPSGREYPVGYGPTNNQGRTADEYGLDPNRYGWDGHGWALFGAGGYAASPMLAMIGDRPGGEYVLGGDQIANMLGTAASGGGRGYTFINQGTVLGELDWFVRMNDEARRRGRAG